MLGKSLGPGVLRFSLPRGRGGDQGVFCLLPSEVAGPPPPPPPRSRRAPACALCEPSKAVCSIAVLVLYTLVISILAFGMRKIEFRGPENKVPFGGYSIGLTLNIKRNRDTDSLYGSLHPVAGDRGPGGNGEQTT